MKKESDYHVGTIEKGDEIIYSDKFSSFVRREHNGNLYNVQVSKNAVILMYIDDEDYTYLTKQYRPAMMKETIAFPAGMMDKAHLTPKETVLEELVEECGFEIKLDQIKYLRSGPSSDGHDTEIVHLFYAYGPGREVGQRLEDSEKIDVIKVKFDDAYAMMERKEIEGFKSVTLLQYEKIKRLEGRK